MNLDIRLSSPQERDLILDFIKAMGSAARDGNTWDGLSMLAVTAWDGKRLIGAIPLEPRTLQISEGASVRIVHETAVAVHPEFRSRGIGSKMQQFLIAKPPRGALFAGVFREQPESLAYRWYRKNGFEPMMHIESWFCDSPPSLTPKAALTYGTDNTRLKWPELATLGMRATATYGGIVDRKTRPLREWLLVHPYRHIYRFEIVCIRDKEERLKGYALLGIGKMHSATDRVDILEFLIAPEYPECAEELFQAILTMAAKRAYATVRWPMARQDPNRSLALRYKLTERWEFDFMLCRLNSDKAAAPNLSEKMRSGWRYLSIDYI